MCGICFALHNQVECRRSPIDFTPLNARGPDFQRQLKPIELSSNFFVTFAVSVLALRGFKQEQPFVDDEGNILLYNGEIYEGPFPVETFRYVEKFDVFSSSFRFDRMITTVYFCPKH